MRHISCKKLVAVALVLSMLFASQSYAKTTQDSINDAKNQINDLQNQKDDPQNEVNNIETRKDNLETNLSGLNGQLSSLVSDMNDLEGCISEKQAEIERAQADLAEAEAEVDKQYADMKTRIQFMYENGETTAWQMLLESSSILDFLNRTEYISNINQYDREMLNQFITHQEAVAELKANLESDMEELLALQDEMENKKSSVNQLINQTKHNIAKADEDLSDAKENVADIDAKLQQMIAYEQQLEEQKAREDAARLEAIRQQEMEDTSGVIYVPADSDLYLLGAIIQCEAEGESYEGKMAVGSVVLNRVKSSYFPGSISGVIYQSGQFSPVASGRLAYRLEAGVNSTCLQAATDVLNGNITTGALYFRRNNGIIPGTVIGNHVFY